MNLALKENGSVMSHFMNSRPRALGCSGLKAVF